MRVPFYKFTRKARLVQIGARIPLYFTRAVTRCDRFRSIDPDTICYLSFDYLLFQELGTVNDFISSALRLKLHSDRF